MQSNFPSVPKWNSPEEARVGYQKAADLGWNELNLGLRAQNESDVYGWKRFRNDPVLQVVYDPLG